MSELWRELIERDSPDLAGGLSLSRVSISKKTGRMTVQLCSERILTRSEYKRLQMSLAAAFSAFTAAGIREGAGRAAALLGIIPFDGRADCPYRQAVLAFRSQTVQSVFGVIRADGFASVNRNFIVRCGFDCLPGEYQVIAALLDAFHLAHFQSLALVLS